MAGWYAELLRSYSIQDSVQVNDTTTMCDFTPLQAARSGGHYGLIIQSVIGIINNTISLLVFFQNKFKNRPAYMILRCFFICNLLLVLNEIARLIIVTPYLHNLDQSNAKYMSKQDIVWSITLLCQMLSNGMLMLLAIIRLLYAKMHHKMRDVSFAYKLTIPGIFFIVVAALPIAILNWISIHENHKPEVAIYCLITMFIIVIFNSFSQIKEKERLSRTSTVTKQLSRYVVWSTSLLIVSTLPYDVSIIVISFLPELDCVSHVSLGVVSYVFSHSKLWNYCINNIVYFILSSEYRKELKSVMKKIISGNYPGKGSSIYTSHPRTDNTLESEETPVKNTPLATTDIQLGESPSMITPQAATDIKFEDTTTTMGTKL